MIIVSVVLRSAVRLALVVAAATVALALTGCGGGEDTTAPRGECPVAPVKVTVSVDQWSDMVRTLAGDCAVVQTVVESTATDPHDFEPTAADTAKLTGADLVVVNGLGYDEWATKAVATASTAPAVVDAAAAAGRDEGANPHVWYDPAAQEKVSAAVTDALVELQPDAADYLEDRSAISATQQAPYRRAVDRAAAVSTGRTYAATEPVAEYLADALGMTDVTPPGFAQAVANESEPAPGDVADLLDMLQAGKVDVLLVNSQAEGNLDRQLLDAAKGGGVPVVTVTESQPPGSRGFVEWQVSQLDALAAALSGPAR